ncbi:hypothetical protein Brms1b_012126 [Colletotrichum noveboracense]|nr:hypothetical protein Brms1b_012126 [Colletotrichum noveboracense]
MTQINLYFYIDQNLLPPATPGGLPQLGNLALARQVGGKANVIFQSKTKALFSNKNLFSWEQKYKIGADSTKPRSGAFVKASTALQTITAGQMCDWKPGNSRNPLQYMPDAEGADSGFTAKYPDGGMFGTKDQPSMWYNSVWCSTANNNYSPIYTDSATTPGLTYRAYLVEDKYVLSWQQDDFAPGVFASSWSSPWGFSISPGNNTNVDHYVSWWFDYGTRDPGQHDPVHAKGDSGPPLANDRQLESVVVSMRLGWEGSEYTTARQKEYATTVREYLDKYTAGWLVVQNVFVGPWLSADIGMRPNTSLGEYMPGETEGEKLRLYFRSLVNNIAPRYSPTHLDWHYGAQPNEVTTGSWTKLFKLFWRSLPPGSVLAAATASAVFLRDVIQSELQNRYNHSATLKFERIETSSVGTATTVISVTGLDASQFANALSVANDYVTKEQRRMDVMAKHPEIQTPDDVHMCSDTNATLEDMCPTAQNREQFEQAPNGGSQASEDYGKPRLIEADQQQYSDTNGHYQQGQGYKYGLVPAVASY